jgi:hypothetical protein
MSNMIISVVAVEVGSAKSKAGKDYEFVEVTYKNNSFQGKVESKKHNQYGDKNVFNTLKGAKNGEVYTITRTKDDNGYWQWVGIDAGESAGSSAPASGSKPSSPSNAVTTPKSNYETSEERAKRQVYIIKQSSLATAVQALKTDKKALSVDEVIDFAKVLEAYVFGVNLDSEPNKLPNVEDDEFGDVPM